MLDLDAYKNAIALERLEQDIVLLRKHWVDKSLQIQQAVRSVNGVIRNLPSEPTADWPPAVPPGILVVTDDHEYDKLSRSTEQDEAELAHLVHTGIPSVEQAAEELSEVLEQSQTALITALEREGLMREEIEQEKGVLRGLEERLATLQEDLRKNKDVLRLRKLGSNLELSYRSGVCPTCKQPLADTLLDQQEAPMPVDDNIRLIEDH